jgi:hypothetical protein
LSLLISRVVAHIDAAIIHKLSQISPTLLKSISGSLDDSLASSMSSSIGYIFSGSHAPSANPSARIKYEVFGDSAAPENPLNTQRSLEYDSNNNRITTYVANLNLGTNHVFKRSFLGNKIDETEHESQVGLANAMNVSGYAGEDDFFVAYESEHHVLILEKNRNKWFCLHGTRKKVGLTSCCLQ